MSLSDLGSGTLDAYDQKRQPSIKKSELIQSSRAEGGVVSLEFLHRGPVDHFTWTAQLGRCHPHLGVLRKGNGSCSYFCTSCDQVQGFIPKPRLLLRDNRHHSLHAGPAKPLVSASSVPKGNYTRNQARGIVPLVFTWFVPRQSKFRLSTETLKVSVPWS